MRVDVFGAGVVEDEVELSGAITIAITRPAPAESRTKNERHGRSIVDESSAGFSADDINRRPVALSGGSSASSATFESRKRGIITVTVRVTGKQEYIAYHG